MVNKIIFHILGCGSIVVLQLGFITTFPAPIHSLQLLLSIVTYMTVIGAYRPALWWAWGGGVMLELFLPHFFGATLLGLIVSVIGTHYLFINFFTNYSFYSVTVLSVVSSLWFAGLQIVVALFAPAIIGSTYVTIQPWSYIGWQITLNVLVVYALFVVMHYITQRFSFTLRTNHHV